MIEVAQEWEPQIGDRVVLLNGDGWVQPFRSFAEKKRPATVRSVGRFDILIAFDVLRGRGYPHTARVRSTDIAAIRATQARPAEQRG